MRLAAGRLPKPGAPVHSVAMKVLVAVLVAAVVGVLAWAMLSRQEARRAAEALQQSNEVVILDFSNRWATARSSLDEQKKVNEVLETNLTDRARQLERLRTEISGLSTDLAKSRAETRTAKEEIAKRDTQISTLEGRNVDLTKQMGELQTDIAGLEKMINETERKLATSEGNRQELLVELKRLQDEKLGLEKQLQDLSFLRDQVRKLKDELTIARRLDWIRRGLYSTTQKKGGGGVDVGARGGRGNESRPAVVAGLGRRVAADRRSEGERRHQRAEAVAPEAPAPSERGGRGRSPTSMEPPTPPVCPRPVRFGRGSDSTARPV
jgi:Tfp pilus assembly protein PilO